MTEYYSTDKPKFLDDEIVSHCLGERLIILNAEYTYGGNFMKCYQCMRSNFKRVTVQENQLSHI